MIKEAGAFSFSRSDAVGLSCWRNRIGLRGIDVRSSFLKPAKAKKVFSIASLTTSLAAISGTPRFQVLRA